MNWQAQRDNSAERIHESEQKDKNKEAASLAKEHHEDIMRGRDRKYVSETTVPAGEIVRPPDEQKEHQE